MCRAIHLGVEVPEARLGSCLGEKRDQMQYKAQYPREYLESHHRKGDPEHIPALTRAMKTGVNDSISMTIGSHAADCEDRE